MADVMTLGQEVTRRGGRVLASLTNAATRFFRGFKAVTRPVMAWSILKESLEKMKDLRDELSTNLEEAEKLNTHEAYCSAGLALREEVSKWEPSEMNNLEAWFDGHTNECLQAIHLRLTAIQNCFDAVAKLTHEEWSEMARAGQIPVFVHSITTVLIESVDYITDEVRRAESQPSYRLGA